MFAAIGFAASCITVFHRQCKVLNDSVEEKQGMGRDKFNSMHGPVAGD
jgi:hypothetical protein